MSELLDESVVVDDAESFNQKDHEASYQIVQKGKSWDLSKIDFDKLRAGFRETKYKNIQIAEMRAFIEDKLRQMLAQNLNRTDFAERFQSIVDRYNAGGSSTENYFEDLMRFAKDMREEDERHVREKLTDDELELYDMLKKEKLTKEEEQKVKLAAKNLIIRLLESHPRVLVQDWWKDSQTQKIVKSAIEEVLDNDLPKSYGRVIFKEKCDNVFNHVVDLAANQRKWAA